MARKPPKTAEATAPPEEKDKGGGAPKYDPRFAIAAAQLCRLGATDVMLAEAFAVSDRSIRAWRCEHPEFAEACKGGKALWDDQVEAALLRRATGYEYESEKIYCEAGKVTRVKIIEHVPPDGWSALKWLCNRRPDQWRDKVDVMATVRPADTSSEPLSPDEWDKRFGAPRRAN